MEFEFPIDKPVETLDGVPAHYQKFFEQTDGGYKLTEEALPVAKEFNGLRKNLLTARSTLAAANKESADRRGALNGFNTIFDGIEGIEERTPEALAQHIEQLKKVAAKGGAQGEEASAEIARVKAAMTEAHSKEKAELSSTVENLQGEIRSLLVDNVASNAVAQAGGNPSLLLPMIKQECDLRTTDEGKRVVVVIGQDGEPRYDSAGNLMTIAQRVEELRNNEAFAGAFVGKVSSGSGTPHSQKPLASNNGKFDASKATSKELIARGLGKMR